MKKFIIILCISLTACVHNEAILKNPITGNTYKCKSAGYGAIGSTLAHSSVQECIEEAKSQGYTTVVSQTLDHYGEIK